MTKFSLRQFWLIFAQATTVLLASYFVVANLKPQWLDLHSPALRLPTPAASPSATQGPTGLPGPAPASYAQAARAAAPAVVAVMALARRDEQGQDPWLRFHQGRRGQTQTGLGSGVIVSADGYVLTNHHVVAGASEIRVQLPDGRSAQARRVGSDPETDLAVLRIALDALPVITPGQAEGLQVGDVVLAIGNPFNVGQTVTAGIVSALGRDRLGINTFENFIQTDAAINPGNSGGALVDARGRLVGINTAIYARRGGGSLGIGFAIPVDSAYQVLQALIKDGQVRRGWIGVQATELSPEAISTYKLSAREGALVSGVIKGSPAARAGLGAGDVVTAVAGQPVRTVRELIAAVAALAPDSQASVQLLRGDKRLELKLKVGLRQPEAAEPPEPD
jgi:serine protease DegQ